MCSRLKDKVWSIDDEKTYENRRNVTDALQFTLALDGLVEDALEALAPRMNMFSLGKVRGVDSALEHPKNVVATIANWMHYEGDTIDPVIHSRMMALPDAPPPRELIAA